MLQLPNVMGFFLGMLQMVLYGIFRNKKPLKEIEEKIEGENVINIKVVGTPENQVQVEPPTKADEEIAAAAAAPVVPCAICVEPSHINVQLESPLHLVDCAA